MAAGLGFKDFQTGEVLTAADVDGYLMQGIWVFANATARDAAVTSPQEGNFAYLKDTNTTTYYTGSAWTNLDTTGMVNPMTTTGDTIYSSSGSTPARLGIGSTGQVLTVAGGVPTWATPAAGGGGKVLQVVQATYDTPVTVTSTTQSDTGLSCSITPSSSSSKVLVFVTQFLTQSRTGTFLSAGWSLVRGSTRIFPDDETGNGGGYADNGGTNYREFLATQTMGYLDSPATTSSVTYKTQMRVNLTAGSSAVIAQNDTTMSSMILMEIGA
jgi:hypothetical protein